MHQITKDPKDILVFNDWAKKKGLRKWEDFTGEHHSCYTKVRTHIVDKEQHGLSAYTELPLGNKIHIDHFKKRALYPHLTFDYENFLVDDRNDNYGACFKDNHADVSQATFVGAERVFCPVGENMADFVEYTIEGKMVPKTGLSATDTKRVEETVRVFNLNHETLKSQRKAIIGMVGDYKKGGLQEDVIRDCMDSSGFPTLVDWALNLPQGNRAVLKTSGDNED